MGQSVAVGGDGSASFSTTDGGAMVWNRAGATWTTVALPVVQASPTPSDPPPVGICADHVASTLIAATFSSWGGSAAPESDMWVLDPEAHEWKPPVRSQVPVRLTPTCGAGHLVAVGSTPLGHAGRFTDAGYLVDVTTGAAEELYRDFPEPPRPELNHVTIIGPWVMRSTMTVDGTLTGQSVPTTTSATSAPLSATPSGAASSGDATAPTIVTPVNVHLARLVERAGWEPMGFDPNQISPVGGQFVGSGIVNLSLSERDAGAVFWRAPATLTP